MELFLGITFWILYLIIVGAMLDGLERWRKHLAETTDLFDDYN